MQHKIEDVNLIVEFGEQAKQTKNTLCDPWFGVASLPQKTDGSRATSHIHMVSSC